MGGFTSAIGGLVGTVGGVIGGGKAADAAKGQAEALRAAAERASAMAQFNPYGMTTNFGTSTFKDGQGGYTLSPELQSIQNRLFAQTGAYDPSQIGQAAQPIMGGASSLFNLGQQYLATSPEQAAQDYMNQQQGLLSSTRAADLARLQTTNFGRGTGGLGVNTGTGGAASNPLAQALFNAQAKQDLQLASQATEAGMARTKFGAGLFGTGGELLGQVPTLTTRGYAPLEAQLGLLGTTERLGQQPFLLSQDLANQYAQAGARAGGLYLQPQQQAANAYAQYQGYSPLATGLQGLGSSIQSLGNGFMAGSPNQASGTYAGRGLSGTDATGYTYANQAGPTQSGGNLYNVGSSGGGSMSWFDSLLGGK
jgi:hypothetical protein